MGTVTIPVDSLYLEKVVQRAFDDPALQLRNWTAESLQGGLELGSAVYRLQGMAESASASQPWSLILKAIRTDPQSDDPRGYRYWRREPEAYQSGSLYRMPAPVTAPRCYDVCQAADGSIWLWLEDVREDGPAEWSLERYAAVARGLGRFNGAFLAKRFTFSETWAAQDWLRKYVEHAAPMVSFICQNPSHPAVQGMFPGSTLPLSLALWDERRRMFEALERLPNCFCHQDAFRRNLFCRGSELVAIDWGYAGCAPVGAELAPLIGVAFELAGFPSSRARSLDQACFDAYLQGLADAGWEVNPRQVRLGYTLTVLLRYIVGATIGELLPALLDEAIRQHWADGIGTTTEKAGEIDPGIGVYYQSVAMEAMKLLGPVFIVRLLARTVGYSVRLGLARKLAPAPG